MASTNELILKELMDINSKIGAIEEHLKNLNSKVANHEKRLNETAIEVDSLKKTVWGMIGGLSVIVLMLQIWI